MDSKRNYPQIPSGKTKATRPISFVVIQFSDEHEHNFKQSKCVWDDLNEVIEVDNRGNLFFDTLTKAMLDGVSRARHDLIAIVHEDVLLVDNWQEQFEESLNELEKFDDQWSVLGSVGWAGPKGVQGHWSDPHHYKNTFTDSLRPFAEVQRLDEQLLIVNRQRLPHFDAHLPGIHHIGRIFAIESLKAGRKTYAINAPTIHKYKDRHGSLVKHVGESEKIQDRKSITYLADKACCDDYVAFTYPALRGLYPAPASDVIAELSAEKLSQLQRPVILLSRGGSGSRLLSTMADDAGLFLGNDVNLSGDSMEMVAPVYRTIIEQHRCEAAWQKNQSVDRLKSAAANMLKQQPADQIWGFKLPENLLILPELLAAFPQTSFIHLIRDPLATCLRRTHMTARLDNHIGRIALPLAYDYFGINRKWILSDSPAMHMAYTTRHQLDLLRGFQQQHADIEMLQIRFEDLLGDPQRESEKMCEWLNIAFKPGRIMSEIDVNRAGKKTYLYSEEETNRAASFLAETRKQYQYKS